MVSPASCPSTGAQPGAPAPLAKDAHEFGCPQARRYRRGHRLSHLFSWSRPLLASTATGSPRWGFILGPGPWSPAAWAAAQDGSDVLCRAPPGAGLGRRRRHRHPARDPPEATRSRSSTSPCEADAPGLALPHRPAGNRDPRPIQPVPGAVHNEAGSIGRLIDGNAGRHRRHLNGCDADDRVLWRARKVCDCAN